MDIRKWFAVVLAVAIPSFVSATPSDIVPTVPPISNVTVAKVCISFVSFDNERQLAKLRYKRCSAPGVFLGPETFTLTLTSSGFELMRPFGAPTLTGTNITFATANTDFGPLPALSKTLMLRALAGS